MQANSQVPVQGFHILVHHLPYTAIEAGMEQQNPFTVYSHLQQLVAHRVARAGRHKHKVKVQLFE